jgi:hypothetical protein
VLDLYSAYLRLHVHVGTKGMALGLPDTLDTLSGLQNSGLLRNLAEHGGDRSDQRASSPAIGRSHMSRKARLRRQVSTAAQPIAQRRRVRARACESPRRRGIGQASLGPMLGPRHGPS